MRKENPSIHWHDWWFNKILMMVVFVGDVVLASQQKMRIPKARPARFFVTSAFARAVTELYTMTMYVTFAL